MPELAAVLCAMAEALAAEQIRRHAALERIRF
jgi:hypothetical protein